MNNNKLALGPLGNCVAIVAVYLLLAWLSTPTAFAAHPGATGGIDGTSRTLIWIASFVPLVLFLWLQLAFFVQLKRGPKSLND